MIKFPVDKILHNYMQKEVIEKTTDKFLFIVSNAELFINMLANGYRAVLVEDDEDIDQFIEYLEQIKFDGTQRTDYMYVLSLKKKPQNDRLIEYMNSDSLLRYHEGWQIFKNKEYLSSPAHSDKLVEELGALMERYEPTSSKATLDHFHRMKEGKSGEDGAVGVFDDRIRQSLLQQYNIFVCGCPYVYENGVYGPDFGGTKIKAIIEKYLYQKFRTSNVIKRIYNLIIETDRIQKSFDELNCYPVTYINFLDCMLDAETMQEIPHSPEHYAINQIPYKWRDIKAATQGKEIDKFLDFSLKSAEDRKMLLQFVGLTLTRDTRQQKFLTLCGVGGTGKSVLIRLIEKAVGQRNVSGVSLQDLSKRFGTSQLVAKQLNSCADLSTEMLEDASTMKKLLGEDNVYAERKGEQGFTFRNYAKILFSTNSLPTIAGERTNGFYRRMLVLMMDRQPKKADPTLLDKLSAEILYFMKLSIEALHEMYINGGKITESDSSRRTVSQTWKDSDVVQAWLEDCCTLDKQAKTDRTAVYESFEQYCTREGRRNVTRNRFYKALREKNFAETTLHGYRYIRGLSVNG